MNSLAITAPETSMDVPYHSDDQIKPTWLVSGDGDAEEENVAAAVDTNLAHFSFIFYLAGEGAGKATSPIL